MLQAIQRTTHMFQVLCADECQHRLQRAASAAADAQPYTASRTKTPRSSLRYSAPMYVNIDCSELQRDPDTDEWSVVNQNTHEKVFLAKVRG